MKAINPELKSELERMVKTVNFDLPGAWKPEHNAAVIVRTILATLGEKDLLADTADARTERTAMVEAILPILAAGAAVNFRRGMLVELGLAPEMTKAEKVAASVAV